MSKGAGPLPAAFSRRSHLVPSIRVPKSSSSRTRHTTISALEFRIDSAFVTSCSRLVELGEKDQVPRGIANEELLDPIRLSDHRTLHRVRRKKMLIQLLDPCHLDPADGRTAV